MLTLKRCAGEVVVIDDQTQMTILDAVARRVTLKITTVAGAHVECVTMDDSLDCAALLVPTADTVVP